MGVRPLNFGCYPKIRNRRIFNHKKKVKKFNTKADGFFKPIELFDIMLIFNFLAAVE